MRTDTAHSEDTRQSTFQFDVEMPMGDERYSRLEVYAVQELLSSDRGVVDLVVTANPVEIPREKEVRKMREKPKQIPPSQMVDHAGDVSESEAHPIG